MATNRQYGFAAATGLLAATASQLCTFTGADAVVAAIPVRATT